MMTGFADLANDDDDDVFAFIYHPYKNDFFGDNPA